MASRRLSGHISPRRASVLAYVASLLLRSLPAIDKEPSPDASHPINFIDAVSNDVLREQAQRIRARRRL